MKKYLVPSEVLTVFVAEGLVPHNCSNLTIELPASGILTLHFTVYLQREDMPKLAAAFAQMHDLMTAMDHPPDAP